ncbi:tetratricopeptide repeat protein, partial [Caminibacter pacificus]
TIYTTLFEKPDIDMNSKDEDILQNTIKNFSPPANEAKISILTNLLSKYPQSAVIKYDLAVFLTSTGRYQEAKSLLESLKTTDSDIISAKEKLLTYLQNTF